MFIECKINKYTHALITRICPRFRRQLRHLLLIGLVMDLRGTGGRGKSLVDGEDEVFNEASVPSAR